MLDMYYNDIKKYVHFMHVPVEFRYTEFHLHDYFEIYFFINGNAKYFIEKKIYSLNHGDLLITNNNEIHKSVVVPGQIYDVISMQIDPAFLQQLSSPKYSLINCFINRPHGENNKIILEKDQLKTVIDIFEKIETAYTSQVSGSEILLVSYLMQLLFLINNNFKGSVQSKDSNTVSDRLTEILEYIDFNLHDDLSLNTLENKFNINHFYLSRLFKKTFGSTLHEYILFKRLSMSKRLLKSGKNVTEACELSGFNDYFHFIRIFKKYVGTSPGKFRKSLMH